MLAAATPADDDGVDEISPTKVCEREIGSRLGREEHFDLISALHKSLRGSDPHASLYWLARMFEAVRTRVTSLRRLFGSPPKMSDSPIRRPSPRERCGGGVSMRRIAEGHLALAQLTSTSRCGRSRTPSTRRTAEPPASFRDHGPLSACPFGSETPRPSLMGDLGYGAGYQYPHETGALGLPSRTCPTASRRRSTSLPPLRQGREPERRGTRQPDEGLILPPEPTGSGPLRGSGGARGWERSGADPSVILQRGPLGPQITRLGRLGPIV